MMSAKPGPIVLFGSGETSPSGRKIFESLFETLPEPPRVALLETPAGFEPNSERVIGKVADFLSRRLQNYKPQISTIPARRRSSYFGPDNPEILAPILQANVIFLGPGSPTYAVRQLEGSLAWDYILARHRLGAALVFASAAVIAASTYALPVYEIYKAGEDLHWKPGLDLFGLYQVPLVLIPHWNNNDGGNELDTSRCFMGQARFAGLMDLLPQGLAVLGLDEKTALVIRPGDFACHVMGMGGVTLLHTGHEHIKGMPTAALDNNLGFIADQRESHVHQYQQGETFDLKECFPLQAPAGGEGLPEEVWRKALDANQLDESKGPTAQVLGLLEKRQEARSRNDWAAADALRNQIAGLGWRVSDTVDGQQVERNP
jgi:cyanophycinase-like exopeptidase